MTTFSDLRRRILVLLEDPTGSGYEDENILDAISSAFDAILPWVPKTASTTITGDGVLTAFSVPADLYDIDAVISRDTGLMLPKASFVPGQYHGEYVSAENNWILYPHGSISFSKPLPAGTIYDIYYLAQWTKPTSSTPPTDPIEPPEYSVPGICFSGAAAMLVPASISTSETRQFATKIESGTPEHNPLQKSVTFLNSLFMQEMSRMPKRVRGVS